MDVINLVKIYALNSLGINKIIKEKDKSNKAKEILVVISFFIVFTSVLGASFMYNFVIGKYAENTIEVPQIMMGATSILIILIGIFTIRGTLVSFKGYESQMTLPVKSTTIIISRLIILYSYSLLLTLIVLVPSNVYYGIMENPSIIFYCIGFVIILFVPILSMIVASLIGIALELLITKIGNKKFGVSLSVFMFLCVLFTTYSNSYDFISINNISKLISIGARVYPLASIYIDCICNYNILSILIFVILSIGILVVFICFLEKKFKWINTELLTNKVKGDYRLKELEEESIGFSLFKKELRKYFSCSTYVFNTIFGMITLVIFTISIVVIGEKRLAEMLGSDIIGIVKNIIPLIISSLIVTTTTSASAISLEGKNIWILKTLPIEPISIINSIIGVNLVITMPVSIVCSIIISIVFKFNFIMTLLSLIIPIIYSLFTGVLGVTINLMFPVLNWDSEVVVVKQSISALLAVLIGGILVGIPIMLAIFINWFSVVYILIFTFIIMSIITIMIYNFLCNRGNKIFYSI